MKPSASFKLSKSTKRMMAATADPVKSNQIKRMFIAAEVAASLQPRMPKRREAQGE